MLVDSRPAGRPAQPTRRLEGPITQHQRRSRWCAKRAPSGSAPCPHKPGVWWRERGALLRTWRQLHHVWSAGADGIHRSVHPTILRTKRIHHPLAKARILYHLNPQGVLFALDPQHHIVIALDVAPPSRIASSDVALAVHYDEPHRCVLQRAVWILRHHFDGICRSHRTPIWRGRGRGRRWKNNRDSQEEGPKERARHKTSGHSWRGSIPYPGGRSDAGAKVSACRSPAVRARRPGRDPHGRSRRHSRREG